MRLAHYVMMMAEFGAVVEHSRKPGQPALAFHRAGTVAAPVLEITCGEQKDRIELKPEGAVLTRQRPKNVSLILK